MNHDLPPISSPPAQRWREFRIRYLPAVVFAAGVLVAALLWSRWVAPATLLAEAEAVQADVRCAQPGVLTGLKVSLLQPVAAGDIVGYVATAEPRVVEANLAMIRAEIEMQRATLRPATDQQRIVFEAARLRYDWMNQRVQLAALQAQLQLAEAEFTRATPLRRDGLLTEEMFEKLKIARDGLTAQLTEQAKLVAGMEPVMREAVAGSGAENVWSAEAALAAAIKVLQEKLRLVEAQLTPVPLKAPIAGVVSLLHRRAGETVSAGEIILRISATRSDRLVGYLRQPLSFEPKAGMAAEIRTRRNHRQAAASTVSLVGAAMEPIPPSLLAAMHLPPSAVEQGLRIFISRPPGLDLTPGELVDVVIVDAGR